MVKMLAFLVNWYYPVHNNVLCECLTWNINGYGKLPYCVLSNDFVEQKKVIQDKNSAYYFFLPEVYFYLNKVLFLHQYSVSATFSLSPFLSSTPTSPRQSDWSDTPLSQITLCSSHW